MSSHTPFFCRGRDARIRAVRAFIEKKKRLDLNDLISEVSLSYSLTPRKVREYIDTLCMAKIISIHDNEVVLNE